MSAQSLVELYRLLLARLGPQHWWPAQTAEEVLFGAILAQNTAWSGAAQAIAQLRAAGLLRFRALAGIDPDRVAQLIRPARFMNQKARALLCFADYLGRGFDFSLARMRRQPISRLRPELLGLYRIGPETADSMLLYALGKPVFVIDLYTRRILSRHGLLQLDDSYDRFQQVCTRALPVAVPLYNELHALLVRVGNCYCKPQPRCAECPLKGLVLQDEHAYA